MVTVHEIEANLIHEISKFHGKDIDMTLKQELLDLQSRMNKEISPMYYVEYDMQLEQDKEFYLDFTVRTLH
ncbi:hypothetical protein BN80_223 [Yersinia phage phiR1-RT]|uniref:Uncharacterized protein n=2 Tax=Tegunavirus TaxID=1921704 RepID=A0A0B4ZZN9_9CAUD|nr:hypothetical protein BN80_223 [Yersinia phage phiR1-RT]YP_009200479.1 hypothetical protein AVV33_gp177 [Yersinia phage vB_YenM_TG1]AJD82028.1 hypothetical protein YenMTG1_218 [Yersinia phage vB_YenM_TG1]CCI88793.1 hypothetical protein BN80_223 [Yersinia phage phiR1-RT]